MVLLYGRPNGDSYRQGDWIAARGHGFLAAVDEDAAALFDALEAIGWEACVLQGA